jgi:hypothetical protein
LNDYLAFLEGSILSPDYRIPDELNNAIRLTTIGVKIRDSLVTREKVSAMDANVLCLLKSLYGEPLVDIEQTDLRRIHNAINGDVLSRDLRFPFRFGNELYDRAAELFPEERRFLNFDDTGRLLDGSPIGVFQCRNLLSGPYGLLESPQQRFMSPDTRVPFFHCSDVTCGAVHTCRLSTDSYNSINENRTKIDRLLEAEYPEPYSWGEFLAEISGLKDIIYDDKNASSIPFLLGDALSVAELRVLVEHLLDKTSGRKHSVGVLSGTCWWHGVMTDRADARRCWWRAGFGQAGAAWSGGIQGSPVIA